MARANERTQRAEAEATAASEILKITGFDDNTGCYTAETSDGRERRGLVNYCAGMAWPDGYWVTGEWNGGYLSIIGPAPGRASAPLEPPGP